MTTSMYWENIPAWNIDGKVLHKSNTLEGRSFMHDSDLHKAIKMKHISSSKRLDSVFYCINIVMY